MNSLRLLRQTAVLCIGFVSVSTSFASTVEKVTVIAQRPYYHDTLEKIFVQYRYDKSRLVSPAHVNDVLTQSPLVSLNGQGGQIQNISIRGFSRWRIQSLLDGVPINSDRRAGASVGFVPPSFIDSAWVIPGAASTYLGSGAIGGAVNMLLSETRKHELEIGWGANQNLYEYGYSGYNDTTDWKIAYRTANNSEDARGNTLFDAFNQTALFLRHRPQSGALSEIWSLYSDNRDVGKSSSDYPQNRITTYPKNTHWLGKATFAFDSAIGNVWWHQAQLDTHVLRPQQRINQSQSSALNIGADMGDKITFAEWLVNWQMQIHARHGVVIDERELTTEQQLVYQLQTLDASSLGFAAVVDASRTYGSTSIAVGARADTLRQSSERIDKTKSNASGFIGISHSLAANWSTSMYVSSAFRNPTLTERFFQGETPRGRVLGDVNLDTEQAINIQGALSFNSARITGMFDVFYQNIDNYIERITSSSDIVRYANLDSATVKGVSYQLTWKARTTPFNVLISGAWIQGKDQSGNSIADIPAHNQRIDLTFDMNRWRFFTSLQYRANKTAISSGERKLNDVTTLDIGAHWRVTKRMTVSGSWRNLTNQHYYASADDSVAFAQGQSLQLRLAFSL
ncbi:TonB-dependent receptor plug domain-containing protein [Alteromonas sp. A079]|uniref:TonB-dependent receptor plug domain-containing protein n=1 Tax=Alteromonas sp. A079 TaxID=3410268 RepID=UPI003BA09293